MAVEEDGMFLKKIKLVNISEAGSFGPKSSNLTKFELSKVQTINLGQSSTLEKFELYQGSLIWTLKITNNVVNCETNEI